MLLNSWKKCLSLSIFQVQGPRYGRVRFVLCTLAASTKPHRLFKMERDKYPQKVIPSICIFSRNIYFRELKLDQSHLINKQMTGLELCSHNFNLPKNSLSPSPLSTKILFVMEYPWKMDYILYSFLIRIQTITDILSFPKQEK